MNVSLTPYFEEYIQSLISSGKYHSASEVVREALRLHQEKKSQKAESSNSYTLEELRELVDAGLNSPERLDWDFDSFIDRARQRHDEKKAG